METAEILHQFERATGTFVREAIEAAILRIDRSGERGSAKPYGAYLECAGLRRRFLTKLRIFETSVIRGKPRRTAAPFSSADLSALGPPTESWLSCTSSQIPAVRECWNSRKMCSDSGPLIGK